jgi:hypothetical protein
MRGRKKQQETIFSLRTPGDRVPKDHPLRRVKQMADAALRALSPTFERMYSNVGRPSIPTVCRSKEHSRETLRV